MINISYPILLFIENVPVTKMMHRSDMGWTIPHKVLCTTKEIRLEYKEGEKVTKNRLKTLMKKFVKEFNSQDEDNKIIGVIDMWFRNLIYKDESVEDVSDGKNYIRFDDLISFKLNGLYGGNL